MRIVDLPSVIKKQGIDSKLLVSTITDNSTGWVIEEGYGRWSVYHIDHNRRSLQKSFFVESEACDYLLMMMNQSQPT